METETLRLPQPVIAAQLCRAIGNHHDDRDDSYNCHTAGPRGAARYSKIVFGYDDFERRYARPSNASPIALRKRFSVAEEGKGKKGGLNEGWNRSVFFT